MSAETVAYAALSASPGLTNLVGTRIYPDFVPQEKVLPAVAITRTESDYITTIHSATPEVTIVTIEVWCMASTRAEAEQIADSALTLLADSSFQPKGRRPEVDAGPPELIATVLTMEYWET